MRPRRAALLLALTCLAGAVALHAADQDDEAALFGGATPSDAFATGANKEDPLQIGGVYYQQWIASPQKGQSAGQTQLSMPLNLDAFFDARPNDRIRAYLGARLLYDPSRDAYSTSPGLAAIPTVSSLGSLPRLPNNPQVVLDQAWLKFDAARTVFITAGKQHAKWGSARIWNPSDALNPVRRDPLQPFDLRLGNNMLKMDMPVGAVKGNLSAIVLLDDPQPAGTLQQLGAAFRAEAVLFGAELGLDMATRAGRNPVYGADLSTPLGPLDVYAEAAMLSGESFTLYEPGANPGSDIESRVQTRTVPGPALQASLGAHYSFAYAPNRQATAGAEYFYNGIGADSAKVYPVLMFYGLFQSFYAGRHYAAVYLSAEGLDAAKHSSYNFSTISNISDGSYVSRVDLNWRLLEYLDLGAFADLHYGTEGGEFNFSLGTPALTYRSVPIPPLNIPARPFDLGLSLRVGF